MNTHNRHDSNRELIWALMRTLIKLNLINDSELRVDEEGIWWINSDSEGGNFVNALMNLYGVDSDY